MQWTIRNKMLAAFAVVLALLVVQLSVNWYMMEDSIALTTQARDKGYAGAHLAAEINLEVVQVQQWLTDISATRGAEGFDDGYDEAEKHAALFRQHIAALIALHPDDREKLQGLSESFEAFYEKGTWMANEYITGGPDFGNMAMEEFDAFAEDIGARLETLVAEMNTEAEGSIQGAIDEITSSQNVGLIFVLVVIASTIVIALVLSGTISSSIKRCVDFAQRVAEGDLTATVAVTCKDETGALATALTSMVANLKQMNAEIVGLADAAVAGKLDTRGDADQFQGDYAEIIQGVNNTLDAVIEPINEAAAVLDKVANRDLTARVVGDYQGDHANIKNSLNTAVQNLDEGLVQVGSASDQVSSASGQISGGSQALAQGASEQASSLEEVSSSLEEMASMTKQNAENSNQAKSLAQNARESADSGTEAMERMTQSINSIKGSSDETAKIVKTIDEIAFQTNLLALNAAVEAARAGEAGKGFAVVAEEVRNLAQRSAEAAKNTADLIEESVNNADQGVKVTEEVAQILSEIAEGSRKVNDLVGEIAAASDEQSQGIEQVNSGVAQMNQVTQQNAANAEESASAAEELNGQATELQNLVGQFTLSESGRKQQTVAQSAPQPLAQVHSLLQEKKEKQGSTAVIGNGQDTSGKPPELLIPLGNEDEGVLNEF